jgi:hypothetical protein
MKSNREGLAFIEKRRNQWLGALPFAVATLLSALPSVTFGHQSPPGCQGTGGQNNMFAFRADKLTLLQSGDEISPCETIFYQAEIARSGSPTVCDFEGVTSWTITTPDGVVHNAVPVGGIGLVNAAVGFIKSEFVAYQTKPTDGVINASHLYITDFSHDASDPVPGHTQNLPLLGTGIQNRVTPCPPPGPCQTIICNPNLIVPTDPTDPTRFKMGGCVTNDLPQPTCSILPHPGFICAVGGSPVTFNLSIVDNGGAGARTVTWTGPAGFVPPAPGNVLSITTSIVGTYNAQISFANGCQTNCTTELIPVPNPTCNITGPLNPCFNTVQQYTVTTDPVNATVQWSFESNAGGASFVGSTTAKTVSVNVGNGNFVLAVVVTSTTSGVTCTGGCRLPITPIPCEPCIVISQEVVCVQPNTQCEPFTPNLDDETSACGMRNENASDCSAFCFRITIKAICANGDPSSVPLEGIVVTSSHVDISGCNFPTTMNPNDSFSCIVPNVTICENITNVVTVRAVSAADHTTRPLPPRSITNDSVIVEIKPIAVRCESTLNGGTFDLDGQLDNCVTVPIGSTAGLLLTTTIYNDSDVDLDVTVANLPPLVDCISGAPIVTTQPIFIARRSSHPITGCVIPADPCVEVTYNITVSGSVSTNGSNADCECYYNHNGEPITTTVDANNSCPVCIRCDTPVTCRVTGGGVLLEGFVDQSCIEVTTTIFPRESRDGKTINKITHGGQLGAPFSHMDCEAPPFLGNPCIRGQWSHVRHYNGTGNPRDNFDFQNFHSTTPKGIYDSLDCACLGCCIDGDFVPPTVGPLIKKFQLCNPDDHKNCGPQPRPAPANVIIWSGIGKVTPEDDIKGARAALAEWVVFRIYIEDRSEPGGGHPGGAVEPADIYCFQAWKTGIKVSKRPDFSTISNALREALAVANCEFLDALERGVANGGLAIGTLPSPIVNGVTADVQDCGPMSTGNHQIHPSTGATCTE